MAEILSGQKTIIPIKSTGRLLCFILILCWFHPCSAKPKLSIRLEGGAGYPFLETVSNITKMDTISGSDYGYPYIADLQNSVGPILGASIVLGTIELRYSFSWYGWREETITYRGDRKVRRLSTGEIDDATVIYTELPDPETKIDINQPKLQVHTISAEYRLYLIDDSWEFYFPLGGGLAISTFDTDFADNNFGLYLTAGIGTCFPVNNVFALTLNLRYNFILTKTSQPVQHTVNNTVVSDGTVFSALTDTFHIATLHLGLRITFK